MANCHLKSIKKQAIFEIIWTYFSVLMHNCPIVLGDITQHDVDI